MLIMISQALKSLVNIGCVMIMMSRSSIPGDVVCTWYSGRYHKEMIPVLVDVVDL